LIQKELLTDPFPYSEKDGLNLVVTVPEGTTSSSNLPVFVWYRPATRESADYRIHGGGFVGGAGNWVQYDHSRLVALSSQVGTPIIGVGINYRLGPLGFLTSSALAKVGLTGITALRINELPLNGSEALFFYCVDVRFKRILQDSGEALQMSQ
jgi:carboxylesterase type B